MKLLSVNISLPKEVAYHDQTLLTGIYKEASSGRVMLHEFNVEGDGQADTKHHGGTYQAAYAYPIEHYAHWQQQLGRETPFPYGQFGENFTTQGLTEDHVRLGDILQIGGAVVQVTQPRIPCFKLAHKMNEPRFAEMFWGYNRPGFYLRVLETGEVGAGDAIRVIEAAIHNITIADIFGAIHTNDKTIMQRALDTIPDLTPNLKKSLEYYVNKEERQSNNA